MDKFKGKATPLTLGAALLAIFIVLHIIIPGGNKAIQGLLMVITFLPVTIYATRFGIKKALVMAAAGGALSALLLPLEVALSFAVPALLIGLAGGLFYGKRKRLTVILIFSVMHMLQNIVELLLYYLLTGINFMDTYRWAVDLAYQKIPADWLAIPLFSQYVADLMIFLVPCFLVLCAGAKGILSFLLIRVLRSRLTSVMGPDADAQYTQQTKFGGKGISIAYFCVISVCALVVMLPVLGIIPYHFVCAVAASLGLLLAIMYFYYFYISRVRSQKDHQQRLIYSFLMMVLLPINIFTLPWVEIHLLKKEAAAAEK